MARFSQPQASSSSTRPPSAIYRCAAVLLAAITIASGAVLWSTIHISSHRPGDRTVLGQGMGDDEGGRRRLAPPPPPFGDDVVAKAAVRRDSAERGAGGDDPGSEEEDGEGQPHGGAQASSSSGRRAAPRGRLSIRSAAAATPQVARCAAAGPSHGGPLLLSHRRGQATRNPPPLPYRYPVHDRLLPRLAVVRRAYASMLGEEEQAQTTTSASATNAAHNSVASTMDRLFGLRGSVELPVHPAVRSWDAIAYEPRADAAGGAKLRLEYSFGASAAVPLDSGHPGGGVWMVPSSSGRNKGKQAPTNFSIDEDAESGDGDGEDDATAPRYPPCFPLLLRMLWRHQHPGAAPAATSASTPCLHNGEEENDAKAGGPRFLTSRLKEGAHGVGSAVSLLAHDLLTALSLGRIFTVEPPKRRWFFAPQSCPGGGWECLFMPPTACSPKAGSTFELVKSLASARASKADVIRKASYDIPGMGRSDVPGVATLFDTSSSLTEREKGVWRRCATAQLVPWLRWLQQSSSPPLTAQPRLRPSGRRRQSMAPAMVVLMGTFAAGGDPTLVYLLAGATTYLLRGVQPWLRDMLVEKLTTVITRPLAARQRSLQAAADDVAATAVGQETLVAGPSSSAVPMLLVYLQGRGEIAKYREYYNAFGCHRVSRTAFEPIVSRLCVAHASMGRTSPMLAMPMSRGGSALPCAAYISGNTPYEDYDWLRSSLTSDNVTRSIAAQRDCSVRGSQHHHDASSPSLSPPSTAVIHRAARILILSVRQLSEPTGAADGNAAAGSPKKKQTAAVGESDRWGDASASGGWVDLYAGVVANAWACVVQSNWCRIIHFLRLGFGKGDAPLADLGLLMLMGENTRAQRRVSHNKAGEKGGARQVDDEIPASALTRWRDAFCEVNSSWPTKRFDGAQSW